LLIQGQYVHDPSWSSSKYPISCMAVWDPERKCWPSSTCSCPNRRTRNISPEEKHVALLIPAPQKPSSPLPPLTFSSLLGNTQKTLPMGQSIFLQLSPPITMTWPVCVICYVESQSNVGWADPSAYLLLIFSHRHGWYQNFLGKFTLSVQSRFSTPTSWMSWMNIAGVNANRSFWFSERYVQGLASQSAKISSLCSSCRHGWVHAVIASWSQKHYVPTTCPAKLQWVDGISI
jgi:hypothetical protein